MSPVVIEAPLYRQIASLVEDAIVSQELKAGQRAPSTNELARFHSINPATARKGLALLVAEGTLEPRRGVGMFVAKDAASKIQGRRREEFTQHFLVPLVDEAVRLELPRADIHELLDRVAESRGLYR